MSDRSLDRLGGACSILVGASYVVIGITQLMLSPELTVENNAAPRLMFFEANRVPLMIQYWAMALGAVFGLAVIPAVAEKVRHINEGWVRWLSTLATIGLAATLIDNYWGIVFDPPRIELYNTLSEEWRIMLAVPGAAQSLDSRGVLQFGSIGLWVLVMCLLALRGNAWPRGLSYLGIVLAVAYFLVLATILDPSPGPLVQVVAGVGGVIIAPLWYGWMGLYLWNSSRAAAPRPIEQPVPGQD